MIFLYSQFSAINVAQEKCIANVFGETGILEHWSLEKDHEIGKNEKKKMMEKREEMGTMEKIKEKEKIEKAEKIKEKKKIEKAEMKEKLENVAEAHLVVTTLITTVTFAAGISLSGGFEGVNNQYPGSVVLRRSAAFKAFIFFDVISMVLSCCAIFVHLLIPILMVSKSNISLSFLQTAALLILLTMGTMVLAFSAGTYVVLAHSLGLAITSCVIALFFFLIICLVFRKLFKIVIRTSGGSGTSDESDPE